MQESRLMNRTNLTFSSPDETYFLLFIETESVCTPGFSLQSCSLVLWLSCNLYPTGDGCVKASRRVINSNREGETVAEASPGGR